MHFLHFKYAMYGRIKWIQIFYSTFNLCCTWYSINYNLTSKNGDYVLLKVRLCVVVPNLIFAKFWCGMMLLEGVNVDFYSWSLLNLTSYGFYNHSLSPMIFFFFFFWEKSPRVIVLLLSQCNTITMRHDFILHKCYTMICEN